MFWKHAGTMVRLLSCDLEVMGSNPENSLSACGGKLHKFTYPRLLPGRSLVDWAALFFFSSPKPQLNHRPPTTTLDRAQDPGFLLAQSFILTEPVELWPLMTDQDHNNHYKVTRTEVFSPLFTLGLCSLEILKLLMTRSKLEKGVLPLSFVKAVVPLDPVHHCCYGLHPVVQIVHRGSFGRLPWSWVKTSEEGTMANERGEKLTWRATTMIPCLRSLCCIVPSLPKGKEARAVTAMHSSMPAGASCQR